MAAIIKMGSIPVLFISLIVYFISLCEASTFYSDWEYYNYKKENSREGKFANIYRVTSKEDYDQIVSFDSMASFSISAERIEEYENSFLFAKKERNFDDTYTGISLVLVLSEDFINGIRDADFVAQQLENQLYYATNTYARTDVVLLDLGDNLTQSNIVQDLIDAFRNRHIKVILKINNIINNVAQINSGSLLGINLVNYAGFDNSAREAWRTKNTAQLFASTQVKILTFASFEDITKKNRSMYLYTTSQTTKSTTSIPHDIKSATLVPEIIRPVRNGFTILFKGIRNYNILRYGGFDFYSPILVTVQDVFNFPTNCLDAVLDRRSLVLMVEKDEMFNIHRNESFKNLYQKLKIEYITLADNFYVTPDFLNFFENAKFITVRPFEGRVVQQGFLVVNLDNENPTRALWELNSYKEGRKVQPLNFCDFINPASSLILPLSEDQKIAQVRHELDKYANQSSKELLNIHIDLGMFLSNPAEMILQLSDQRLWALPLKFDLNGMNGREWYSMLMNEIFNPRHELFKPLQSNPNVYIPVFKERFEYIDGSSHLKVYQLIGKIMGQGLMDNLPLNFRFTRSFYKFILDMKPDLNDLNEAHPRIYQTLCWIAENDLPDLMKTINFRFESEEFEKTDLKSGGNDIYLDDRNKFEYINLVIKFILEKPIKSQVAAFLVGFWSVVPKSLLSNLTIYQLERLLAGESGI